jgi:hypothetical protein
MFILLYEFSTVLKPNEMNYNLVLEFFTMYFKVQILVIWNNHESGVLMNGKVKYVENQGKNSECMLVKCKSIVIIVWNNFVGIKFHFYHLVTILGKKISIFYRNRKVCYKFCCCIVEESVQKSCFIFQFRIRRVC